jgi:DNA invertase Pin-like site-specific DNA recombinase
MKRQSVALYARVSTNSQDVSMQLKELREFAKRRGMDIYKEYIDSGISGSVGSRPALNEMRQDARKRMFTALICWKVDRVARSVKNLLNLIEELEQLNINFISYNDNIDTTIKSPITTALLQLMGIFGELEKNIIKSRVLAGLANAKAKGRVFGRPKVDNKLIEKAKDLKNNGVPMKAIARQLAVSERSLYKYLQI